MEGFAPDLIHLCLELRPTAEVQRSKKLVLLTVECKGIASPLCRLTNLVPEETNWRVKAQFAERIRMVAAGVYRESSGG